MGWELEAGSRLWGSSVGGGRSWTPVGIGGGCADIGLVVGFRTCMLSCPVVRCLSFGFISFRTEGTDPHPYTKCTKRCCPSSALRETTSKTGMSSSGTCPIPGLYVSTYSSDSNAGDSCCFAEEKSQLAMGAWLQLLHVQFPRCRAPCADSRLPTIPSLNEQLGNPPPHGTFCSIWSHMA